MSGWSVLRDLERRGFLREQCANCGCAKVHHEDDTCRNHCRVCWKYCVYDPAFVPLWKEDDEPWCDTAIAHGPGHQSISPCEEIGQHKVHHYDEFAWRDQDLREGETYDRLNGRTYRLTFSGFFDESPYDD